MSFLRDFQGATEILADLRTSLSWKMPSTQSVVTDPITRGWILVPKGLPATSKPAAALLLSETILGAV